MNQFYSDQDKHLVAVDCIIFGFDGDELKLLLIKRDFEPDRGKLSLIGGFLKKDESTESAARRILHQLTGLNEIFLEEMGVYSDPLRDPGERTLSVAYVALLKLKELDSAYYERNGAFWYSAKEIPALIFDHNKMVSDALRFLRQKSAVHPVGVELLPERFTLPSLQELYEAIYDRKIDKRNFRKKVLSSGWLAKHLEKDMSGSKKGAFLYSFNNELDKNENLKMM